MGVFMEMNILDPVSALNSPTVVHQPKQDFTVVRRLAREMWVCWKG